MCRVHDDLIVRHCAASHACQSLSVCRRVKSPCEAEVAWPRVLLIVMKMKLNWRIFVRLYNMHHDGRMEKYYCRMMNDVFDV